MTTRTNLPVAISINKLKAGDSDPDGNTLSITAAMNPQPSGASVSFGETTITYTPLADFNGAGSFDYTLNDGHGGTATVTVSVTVSVNNVGSTIGSLVVLSDPTRVVLTASGKPSTAYIIQKSDNGGVDWSNYDTVTSAANGVLIYTDTAPNPNNRIYRLAQ